MATDTSIVSPIQFARATVSADAVLPAGYERYRGQSGIIIQRYSDDGVCL
ncbi:MAG TPA: hypothetical protein VII61_02710 [Ktedonobacteraceae bacterium]